MTEREKQLSGMTYDGRDEELINLQIKGQELARQFNTVPLTDSSTKESIVSKLFNHVGDNLRIYPPLRVDFGINISLGDDVLINQNCTFLDNNYITIGSRVLIGPDVKMYTACHPLEGHERCIRESDGRINIINTSKPIVIGDDVWIGGGSIILPGITIGNNVVVAAGSVVTKNVSSNTIVAGNPAKPIKTLVGK